MKAYHGGACGKAWRNILDEWDNDTQEGLAVNILLYTMNDI